MQCCVPVVFFLLAAVNTGRVDCHRPQLADGAVEEFPGPNLEDQGPRQERKNRMVPDFQPYLHPAAKVRMLVSYTAISDFKEYSIVPSEKEWGS
jgi:hypothetical protein